tara:strand:+ start:1068 stop:3143 length:2076 start_codon:yes stop_codon:yes gene_type:complete
MPRSAPIFTNFTAGELSPRLEGRVDLTKYPNGCKTLENMIVQKHGPASRRGGFYFSSEVKDSSKKTRILPFEFSATQAYVIEFGDEYIRFYKNYGQIQTGMFSEEFDTPFSKGSAYEVSTPYLEDELFDLVITQSADVLYIAHQNHEPRTLSRLGDTNWNLDIIDFLDGPYDSINTTTTTLGFSATTGTGVTVTASAVAGINNGSGFLVTDIGRLIRFEDGASHYTYLKITARADTTHVTADFIGPAASATTARTSWRLGAFSATTGYPSVVTFFEQRLVWAATTNRPQSMFFSVSADYENHAPTNNDGDVLDDSGFVYTIATDQVNTIRWMRAGKVLSVGTAGGEFIVSQGDQNSPLSPTNTRVVRQTTFGSAAVTPPQVGNSVLFLQRANRKIREYVYQFESDAYTAPDLSILSEHITEGGVVDMAYQQEPNSIVWLVRSDGVLVGMTYERSQDVVGWHRHIIGGVDAKIESVSVIPNTTGSRDDLWAIIQRTINGQSVRYIEFMTTGMPEVSVNTIDATYLDSMLSYDGSPSSQIFGLSHLEGQTVSVLANGAAHPDRVVSSGSITLNDDYSVAHIGLPYTSTLQTMRIEAGAKDGTAQGKKKRIARITYRLYDTLGLKHGPSADRLDIIPFRSSADDMDEAPALFTGDKEVEFPRNWDKDGYIFLVQDQPLPFTVLAIMPELNTTKV